MSRSCRRAARLACLTSSCGLGPRSARNRSLAPCWLYEQLAIDDIAVTPEMTMAVDELSNMITEMTKYKTVDALLVPIRPEQSLIAVPDHAALTVSPI